MATSRKNKKAASPIGRPAFLRDCCCAPGQIGCCRVVGPSLRGPEWVIVEWTKDDWTKRTGDVSVVLLAHLDVR